MAASDPQKQFLTLIRGFASESSQGERRIVDLRKRINELRSEIVAANAELEDAKRVKEITEQELKGFEVESAMTEASIQILEARISLIQDEVSTAGSDVEALKIEEGTLRDDFIEKMSETNANIREFQKTVANAFNGENCIGTTSKNGPPPISETRPNYANVLDAEVSGRALENKIAQIISQTNTEEQEYQAEQIIYKQVQQELIELEEKVSLMEALLKVNQELQELTRSEFEEISASLGDELQKRCLCPSCHLDNSEALGGILQAASGS